jgi:two-component system LytT family sensor kinase
MLDSARVPHGPTFLSTNQVLLTTLLVQLAVVAVVATMLVRFWRFRRILLSERRPWSDRLVFAVALGVPLSLGVASRLLLRYDAADVSLAGPFLAGLIAGPYAGALVGAMVGLPAFAAHEIIAVPFAVGCGFAGGGLRELCPKEAIWHFSPFVFTRVLRYLWAALRRFEVDWQIALIAAPIALELLRQALGRRFGEERLFYLHADSPWLLVVVLVGTMLSVAIPIKIWNNARIEHKLEEQEKLLMAARIQSLTNQINPHFLFNTLASISSLIRSQPETARLLIIRLSMLLRRLLRSQDHFVTLRDELSAVDEYLDIECVRFGSSLQVDKDIAPDTLDQVVPSMILQPLVENSIKHGLANKIGGGRVLLRSGRYRGQTVVEVIDNGLGMTREQIDSALTRGGRGIGLQNVNERLQVIYGAHCRLSIHSIPGEGTLVRLEIPEVVMPDRRSA